jgi:superfamily II DNA/RNA helicase
MMRRYEGQRSHRSVYKSSGRTNTHNHSGRSGYRGSGRKQNYKQWSHQELANVIEKANRPRDIGSNAVYFITHSFNDFPLIDILKKNISLKHFKEPMPIQDQAIPAILDGKDVIGIANTGTGKTAAFLIPLIDKVFKDRTQKVFIVTPTRELAVQINDEFRFYSQGMGIYSANCIGGTSMYRQIKDLKQNPNFVIGTPGRLRDLLQQNAFSLNQFNNVVLDEADRMLDIGFIDEIKYFITLLPKTRQSLFFSATISRKVQEIVQAFVTNPVTISVKQQETAENIDQQIIRVFNSGSKIEKLQSLLVQSEFNKVLIFGRTKWGVQKLSDELVRRGFKAGAIHGDKRQSQRQQVLDKFKRKEINILLATDVASRGLDIKDVSHVINYDMPESYDDYIHRIGRTGRANKKGMALTFVETQQY